MLTLNQLNKKLTQFFQNHKQINQVIFSSDFDFASNRSLSYPVVNIEYMDASIQGDKVNHNYKVVIADLIDTNVEGSEYEIISDASLIAEDFFTYLQTCIYDFDFNRSSNIQNFTDDNGDRTAGIVFPVSLTLIRSQNKCSPPLKEPYSFEVPYLNPYLKYEKVKGDSYTATTDNEIEVTLNNWIGYEMVLVIKEIKPLKLSEYSWDKNTGKFILLNGLSLSTDESLFFLFTKLSSI